MQRLGYGAAELDDPYAAMAELCRRPLVYRAVVLSLGGLYREELHLIDGVKRRFPHIEIWLSHTDGRQGALADAMRLGADGLLAEDGLHRIAFGPPAPPAAPAATAPDPQPPVPATFASAAEIVPDDEPHDQSPLPVRRSTQEEEDPHYGSEPALTADELKALLHEQASLPPGEE